MAGVWHRGAEDAPGSLKSFGRQLREEYGGAYAGLDDTMLRLLEQLFEIPWGDEEEAAGPDLEIRADMPAPGRH